MTTNAILILDYGSQFTQLIARRVREAHVYCEIHPPTRSLDWIKAWEPRGIILSGGPNSVYDEGAPTVDRGIFDLGVPVWGDAVTRKLFEGLIEVENIRDFGVFAKQFEL